MLAAALSAGQQINRAEYFIDSDPGFGLATPIPIASPGNDLSLSFHVDADGLVQGFHMIMVRARDDLGRWSSSFQRVFYLFRSRDVIESKINQAEYFIDSDPGFGLATPVPIASPGNDLSLSFHVDASGLSQGFHRMMIRACDELGRWSSIHQQVFYVFKAVPPEASDVTGMEYFIDDDPGFGNGTPVNVVSPGKDITADFIVYLGGLSDGDHMFYIRSRDALNRWSHTLAHAFTLNVTGSGEKEAAPWFRLYPNPNAGSFILEMIDLPCSKVMITVSDLSGRTVYSKELHGERIPLSVDLPTGVYMLRIEAGKKSFNQKLIIQ